MTEKCSNPTCGEAGAISCDACDKPHCADCVKRFEGGWAGDTTQCRPCTCDEYEDFSD